MSRLRYNDVKKVSREVADSTSKEDKDKAIELISELLKSIGMDCYILTASNFEQLSEGNGEQVLRMKCSDNFATLHIIKMCEMILLDGDLSTIVALSTALLTAKNMVRKHLIKLASDTGEVEDDYE